MSEYISEVSFCSIGQSLYVSTKTILITLHFVVYLGIRKFNGFMSWILYCPKSYVEVLEPDISKHGCTWRVSMRLLWKIQLLWSSLIQYDYFSYKKRKLEWKYVQRENYMKTQGENGRLKPRRDFKSSFT